MVKPAFGCERALFLCTIPLECTNPLEVEGRWKKKMRGRRRTQEEHTKWSCSCSLLFIDTSSQGEHLQGKAL
ncbi:hypothetical protein PVAP13_9NG426200 [Panicum virgatum]|uniref:Uncharacterized protein n=1 Tax=Panicum virgatum TaxID=38727 RepID=A0A8T0MTI7_PANVG|nr:hypothetical protein PVAP13_9NG426200 [Panicum virgatum]